jgi:hypothetical protein
VTADRRLRVGGWAALLVAILAPLQVIAIWLYAGSFPGLTSPDPWASEPYLAFDVARLIAVLIAVVGLDGLFRSRDADVARRLLAVGVSGAVIGFAADGWIFLGGAGHAEGAYGLIDLAADLLVAAWFVGGGLILLTSGRQLARIGWTAILGGAGQVLTALCVATGFGGIPGISGTALIDWFLLIGLFVVVYLVRVWRYVVGGRLPGPGIV